MTAQTGPDSVELEYFIGTANYPQHILLEWQSVSEQTTTQFRLLRGVTPNPSQAVVITIPAIPAHPGSTQGHYYAYPDSAGLVPGTVYYYWIEDMDMGGLWNTHWDDPNLNPVVPWGCSVYDVICDFTIDSAGYQRRGLALELHPGQRLLRRRPRRQRRSGHRHARRDASGQPLGLHVGPVLLSLIHCYGR
ncbi:MAG: hypothetical protein V9H69_11200 [Anaerolineae bacterium]